MARTNRELVMLAHTFELGKDRTAGMFMSEKLDGMRAVWIPQTKNMPVASVPFANREKDKREHICTGLWSRIGKVIQCPNWFTEGWPDYPLDGELYLGPKQFEATMSVCRKLDPIDADWAGIKYMTFDAPTYSQLFADGRINNPHWSKTIRYLECMEALGHPIARPPQDFEYVYHWLTKQGLNQHSNLKLLPQVMLPFNTAMATERMQAQLETTLAMNGEGLILRHPASKWEAIRTRMLLKVVPEHDSEGVIIGFKAAEYGKDGKLLGRLGSALLRWNDREFALSGFTDEERRLTPDATRVALECPGELLTVADPSVHFHLGDTITFTYKELTADGIPKNGRFKRKA